MESTSAWLASLGLSQYADVFAANDIDPDVLPHLTDQHLRDLGISLGHRLKIMHAVAELRGSALGTERRHVTVMFCDLVGSTALSTQLDPEDLRDIISAFQACVADAVRRHDGYVAKYMGDGALVYLGYPRAHEDDAERAVRAGIDLVSAVAAVRAPVPLQTRIGIATGLVVVGDLIGSGDSRERNVVGETPNLAARLQAIAPPNGVVIADSTRRLLGRLFELEDRGLHDLKGIAAPVQAWTVLGASAVHSRFEALREPDASPLIGRTNELEQLTACWAQAERGRGQIVLLSGDAGIGKSRLTAALVERVNAETRQCLRYFCSPRHGDSALYPIIAEIERSAGCMPDDAPATKLDRIAAELDRAATPAEDAPLFAELLSLPADGRHPPLTLTAQQRRDRTLDAIIRRWEALAHLSPLLIIFEDAHWSDPTSLNALDRLVARTPSAALLLLVTSRPEFRPQWAGSHVTALELARLERTDVEAMVARIAGDGRLSSRIRQDIVQRSDGNPLFAEEITKAVLETASADSATAATPTTNVPASLHASLMARLDRLGSAKSIAQIGAAIGREFSHVLLAAVADRPASELTHAIDRLIESGLLARVGADSVATYMFKHALVQDAAYGTLLRESRRALHARIADALEARFPALTDQQPELLARHATEAGRTESAAALWAKAGQRSLARSALVEAAEQLGRALTHMSAMLGSPDVRRERIKLQVELVHALMHTKGYAAAETRDALERARVLIEEAEAQGESTEDPLLLFAVLYGFWVGTRIAFNGSTMRELAAQFFQLARDRTTDEPLVVAHLLKGISWALTGDLPGGRSHLDQAVAMYVPDRHHSLATRFGHDVRVSALCWRAIAACTLGDRKAALDDANLAVSLARKTNHAVTLMYALAHASLTLIECGEYAAAGVLADELVAFADEKAAAFFKAYGQLLNGCVLTAAGNASEATGVFTTAIAAMRSTGATAYEPWYLAKLARAQARAGHSAEAHRSIARAMTAMRDSGERWCEAEVRAVAGELGASGL